MYAMVQNLLFSVQQSAHAQSFSFLLPCPIENREQRHREQSVPDALLLGNQFALRPMLVG
jgi:tRNA G37 N-methylase TrmD